MIVVDSDICSVLEHIEKSTGLQPNFVLKCALLTLSDKHAKWQFPVNEIVRKCLDRSFEATNLLVNASIEHKASSIPFRSVSCAVSPEPGEDVTVNEWHESEKHALREGVARFGEDNWEALLLFDAQSGGRHLVRKRLQEVIHVWSIIKDQRSTLHTISKMQAGLINSGSNKENEVNCRPSGLTQSHKQTTDKPPSLRSRRSFSVRPLSRSSSLSRPSSRVYRTESNPPSSVRSSSSIESQASCMSAEVIARLYSGGRARTSSLPPQCTLSSQLPPRSRNLRPKNRLSHQSTGIRCGTPRRRGGSDTNCTGIPVPSEKLQNALADLLNSDWEVALRACDEVAEVARNSPGQLTSLMRKALINIERQIQNLRSTVSKRALKLLGELAQLMPFEVTAQMQLVIEMLLTKAKDTNHFLKEEIDNTLEKVCMHCNKIQVLNAVLRMADEKHHAIRVTVSKTLLFIIESMKGTTVPHPASLARLETCLQRLEKDATKDVRAHASVALDRLHEWNSAVSSS